MRVARGEVERAVPADCSDRTRGHAQLAFQARVVIQFLRIRADFRTNENCAEQNEISEVRVNHVAMNTHVAQPRCDRDGFVRHDPHPFVAPTIRLHWKPHRRIHGANPRALQRRCDAAGDVVDIIARMMKLQVRDRARRTAYIVPVHP